MSKSRPGHQCQEDLVHGTQHGRRTTAEKTFDGTKLMEVSDFKYLGSWVDSTEEDIRTRTCLAWAAANKKIWKYNISRNVSSCNCGISIIWIRSLSID